MPTADINGIRIAFTSEGADDRPAMLLVMGLGQQLVAWPEDFCGLLLDAGFRIIRFDNRDTGHSTKFEGRKQTGVVQAFMRQRLGLHIDAPYTLDDLADDAFGLVDHLGIERFHVVGVSMGGMIAQLMAARRPQAVLSLTSVMSTSGERHLPSGRPEALALLARRRRAGTREELIEAGVRTRRVLAGSGYPTPEADMRAASARAIDRMWYPQGYGRHTLAVLASPDRRDLLASLTVPTLVFHGRDDPLVPVAHGLRTAELIPGAKLQVIDGMGHDLPPGVKEILARSIVDHARAATAAA